MKRLNKKGFTLVELLAVIVILALLMVVAANFVGNAQKNAEDTELQTEAQKLINNIETEAKAELMVDSDNSLDDASAIKNTFSGTDGKFIYDADVVKTTGVVKSLKVCYKNRVITNAKTSTEVVDKIDSNACTATGSISFSEN